MNLLYKKANSAFYKLKRFYGSIAPNFIWWEPSIKLKKPIFLCGTQGGGLTLVSRILHRNKRSVYVTGDKKYWAGADEIQNVLKNKLPPSLTFEKDKSWHYATNNNIGQHRKVPNHATPHKKNKLKTLIKKVIFAQKGTSNFSPRFIDKSQLFTIKIGFINKLLKENNPQFVLITRNPFAMIWRDVKNRNNGKSDLENVKLALEHWDNSYRLALHDKEKYNCNVYVFKFEEILNNPQKEIFEICKAVDLQYNEDMIPHKGDKIPFGSNYDAYNKKWYPLRKNVNQKYLEEIPSEVIKMIKEESGDLIKQFKYDLL